MTRYTTQLREASLPVADFLDRFVDVEKFLGYCRECHNYNVHWSCPPYDFDPLELWRKYRELKVVGLQILFEEDFVGTELDSEQWTALYREVLHKESRSFYQMLRKEEEEADGRFLLNPGSCSLCGDSGCDRRKAPCNHPEKRRYSIEALGGNVSAVSEELLGVKMQWIEGGKVPTFLHLVGGILYQ